MDWQKNVEIPIEISTIVDASLARLSISSVEIPIEISTIVDEKEAVIQSGALKYQLKFLLL